MNLKREESTSGAALVDRRFRFRRLAAAGLEMNQERKYHVGESRK